MGWADRALTIVVTATVTSAAWIVAAGTGLIPIPVSTGTAASGKASALASPAPVASSASSPGDERLIVPVTGVEPAALSDTYADARAGGERAHDAIDIMASRGSPVVAAAPGTIEKLFLSDDGGNTIYQRSEDRRTIYYYAHLDRYAPGLAEGQAVARGQTIGAVGSTGNASENAPHLHFAIMRTTPDAKWYDATTAVDPYPLLTGR